MTPARIQRSRRARLSAVAGLATLALVPSATEAAPYTVHSCRTPDGSAAAADGWAFTRSDGSKGSTNGCAGGGSFTIAGGAATRGSHAEWTFEAPADTRISGYNLYRSAQLPMQAGTWATGFVLYGDAVIWDDAHVQDGSVGADVGNPASPVSEVNRLTRTGVSFRRLIAFLDCSAGFPGDCADSGAAQIHRADMTLEDDYDPTFTAGPTGGLVADSGLLKGVEGVSFTAADVGGGVFQTELEIDGAVVERHASDANGGACRLPFTKVVPCKLSAGDSFSLDTTRLSEGGHSVRVIVRDATGQNRAVHGPVKVVVDNVPDPKPASDEVAPVAPAPGGAPAGPGAPNGSGAHPRAVITTVHERSRAASVRTRYGRRLTIRGRLTDPGGRPIAGAALEVLSRVATGPMAPTATVRTDADGRYSYVVPAGPSRLIRVAYRAFTGDRDFADTTDLSVKVTAKVSMRAAPRAVKNGKAVTFRGRVIGTSLPRRGVHVDLQVRQGRWRTFGVARTGRRGAFRFRYRFTKTFRPTTYQFRALVRGESGFPYESAPSNSTKVSVR